MSLGTVDRKWVSEHEEVRKRLDNPPPVPREEDVLAQVPVTGIANLRELDLRNLLCQICQECYGDPGTLNLFWDLSAEASHRWFLNHLGSGWVPCFLAGHKVYSTRRGRYLTGKEHMLLQCFPRAPGGDQGYSVLEDWQLRQLAGLSMHVSQVGAVLAVALAVSAPDPSCVTPETRAECAREAGEVPLSITVKPTRAVDPRTYPCPGLDTRKRKSLKEAGPRRAGTSPGRLGHGVPSEDIQWHDMQPHNIHGTEATMPGDTVAGQPAAMDLLDPDMNAADLTAMLRDRDQWAQELSSVLDTVHDAVVYLGLLPDGSGISRATRDYEFVQHLMGLLARALGPICGDQWVCTGIKIQKCTQQVGAMKTRPPTPRTPGASADRDRGDCSRRSYQFAWQLGSATISQQRAPHLVQGSSCPVADLWCEDRQQPSVGLAAFSANSIRYPWGRCPVNAAEPLNGKLFSSCGRFISFRSGHLRIQDRWPLPAVHCAVEWFAAPELQVKALDQHTRAALGACGFADRHLGIMPHCPPGAGDRDLPDDFEDLM